MTTYSSNTAIDLPFDGMLRQDVPSGDSQNSSTLVHLLDDDSLLVIFSFCRRSAILDENDVDDKQALELLEGGEWNRESERWWHRLIQVCRRWRYLVLESTSHLRLSLVCARGTPVADMLAHSPPLPLIIDHFDDRYKDLTAEEEEGIIFALQHRDRVRCIRLLKPIPILQKLIVALDGEFPILDFLLIEHQRFHRPVIENLPNLDFPETFRAPHLRRVLLKNFATPIESPPLTTMMENLVNLSLGAIPSSGYFGPSTLVKRLSHIPQLERLGIGFSCYDHSRDIERQLLPTPIMTRVTLPNLRRLSFRGTGAYLEALLPRLAIPLLEKLHVSFFNRMIYSISHLRQLTSTTRHLWPKTATFTFFKGHLNVVGYLYNGAKMYTLFMEIGGRHLEWQVGSAAQVFPALKTVFSAVEDLTFEYQRNYVPSEWNRQADRTQWREFLGSFDKVKTLRVELGILEQVSRALQPGEGDSPADLFPELQELSYPATDSSFNIFAPFIDARQKAGHPVTVVHR